jgi:hypothetical protein
MPGNTVSKSGQTNIISSFTSTPTPAATTTSATTPTTSSKNNNKLSSSSSSTQSSSSSSSSSTPDRPPTNNEVSQLQEALLLFYGKHPNLTLSYELLSTCIINWENTHQNTNEIASLYRIRGDINMGLSHFSRAESDYSKAIQYLQHQHHQQQQGSDRRSSIPMSNEKNFEYGGDKEEEDAKEEYIASLLGRARSIRAMGSAASASMAIMASKDYETYFILSSNLDTDDITPTTTITTTTTATTTSATTNSKTNNIFFSDTIIDGIQHNPYAGWEWGMVNRVAKQYSQAALIHGLASTAFYDIGDEPRSVICFLDKGIDMALGLESVNSGSGGGSSNEAQQLAIVRDTLERAISSTVNVSGRDVELLQRLVAKEGEARIVLSGILWNTNNSKNAAEVQYGTACSRLDELNADYNQRRSGGDGSESSTTLVMKSPRGASLGYSIDGIVGADMASCSRFKNEKFVQEKLVWSEGLRSAVDKFLTLSR